MTGSTNNITTQWTFKDGRDYVLSLTNTETPNTVSFWISDKITAEEWTGCYDENCIEILTKRTGCFKSFHIFLAMIKSAVLKKSDSVVLELLNIQDLAALSIHRRTTASTESTNGTSTPAMNFELYNSDVTGGGANRQHTTSTAETNNSNTNGISTGSNKPPSPLNKRKYLIVSYIGEFDKVHYPLPLNYSNPPDLNVMQNNIMKLKAEVTSLKSAKKELEHQLGSVKLSGGGIPQHSHENRDDVKNIVIPLSNDSNSAALSKEPVSISQKLNSQSDFNANYVEGLTTGVVTVDIDKSKETVSDPTCEKCAGKIERLLATICNLEKTITAQRDEYLESMEKLEKENHFLRHKVDTSEKNEMELWNQIQSLEERVRMKETLAEERTIKDTRKNRHRQSRHDLFRDKMTQSGIKPHDASPSRGVNLTRTIKKSQGSLNDKEMVTGQSEEGRKYTRASRFSISNSNSTASYSSTERNSNDNLEKRNQRCRSQSSSSYHTINLANGMSKSRSGSRSPARFDPTAFISEKKMKLRRIADMRMKKIESCIRTGSAGSPIGRQQSISPSKRLTNLTRTVSPITLCKSRRSLSGGMIPTQVDNPRNLRKMDDKEKPRVKRAQKHEFRFLKDRPSSADTCGTKVLSPASRFSFRDDWIDKSRQVKGERGKKIQNKPLGRNIRTSPPDMTLTSEVTDRLIRSPAKKTTTKLNQKSKNMAVNTSFTCDQLESMIELHDDNENTEREKLPVDGKNEKQDISFLQEKLSALSAFLETCKPK